MLFLLDGPRPKLPRLPTGDDDDAAAADEVDNGGGGGTLISLDDDDDDTVTSLLLSVVDATALDLCYTFLMMRIVHSFGRIGSLPTFLSLSETEPPDGDVLSWAP